MSVSASRRRLETAARAAMRHARNAIGPATRRAYAADWRDFAKWCRAYGLAALPAAPTTIGMYLASRAETLKVATLKRRLAAIARCHRAAGAQLDLRHPAVREVLAGILREFGGASNAKLALSPTQLRKMLRATPANFRGLRDRAILLVGFVGTLRRTELVAIDLDALEFAAQGVVLTVRRSKTDQAGRGQQVALPFGKRRQTCPVRALSSWIAAAAIRRGPVFLGIDRHGHLLGRLSDRGIARIVKRYAGAADVDAVRVAGHSLRSGFATSASANGAGLVDIMRQTRHRSESTARRYVQRGTLFRNRAVRTLGL